MEGFYIDKCMKWSIIMILESKPASQKAYSCVAKHKLLVGIAVSAIYLIGRPGTNPDAEIHRFCSQE